MILSYEEYASLEEEVLKKIKLDLNRVNRSDTLEEFLNNIGYSNSVEKYRTLYVKNAKILVFGASKTNVDGLREVARQLGIDPKQLEFRLDYQKNKRFSFDVLKNNQAYSDVLFGPNAHKSMDIGKNTSAIEMFNEHPELYPKKTDIKTCNGTLKITVSSFREALMNTQLYKDMFF